MCFYNPIYRCFALSMFCFSWGYINISSIPPPHPVFSPLHLFWIIESAVMLSLKVISHQNPVVKIGELTLPASSKAF